jgi:uncharacterized lipoprotein YbaY
MRTVRAEVLLPDEVPARAATLRVRVADVSREDAKARVVGEVEERDIALPAGGRLSVDVPVPGDVDPARRYAVQVHVDVDGSGRYGEGDLITTERVPVLTQGAGDSAQVRVRRI